MFICEVFACGIPRFCGKGISVAKIPSVITNQGEELRTLFEKRHNKWIFTIIEKILEHVL